MVSTVKNTAHSEHILSMLEYGLSKGCFSDVVISVSGSRKTILCHKYVLARASPFLASLVRGCLCDQEKVFITLCDISFSEVMAMLNLVYVGSVQLSNHIAESTKAAAKTFLGINVELEKVESKKPIKTHSKRKHVQSSSSKVNVKRPLMIKTNSTQSPIFFVMPATQPVNIGDPTVGNQKEKTTTSETEDILTMNSYQRAKLRCADKFKCDLCGKGFPLSCLLQRHKRTHSDHKPFSCNYCEKSFSSKTSLNHHLFMKHLEEQSKKIEIGKCMIESLKRQDGSNGRVDLNNKTKSVVGGMEASKGDNAYIISEPGRDVENLEIIGVEDITQQIAVQMGKEKVGGDAMGSVTVDNLYYIGDGGQTSNYWDYKS